MELLLSIIAIIISILSTIVSIVIYYRGEKREQKQATLDAFNTMQEQVFDILNTYTFADIKNIAEEWQKCIQLCNAFVKEKKGTSNDFWKQNPEYNEILKEYQKLSGLLARLEHFSLGVNTGIYDVDVTERAATNYFAMLYKKLTPLLNVKNGCKENKYFKEFEKVVKMVEEIEK